MSTRSRRSTRPVSLDKFDVSDTRDGDPVFTPRSRQALEMQGVVPGELAGRPMSQWKDPTVPEEIWRARYEHFETQRILLIGQVKEEYEKILKKEARRGVPGGAADRASTESISGIGVDMDREEEKIMEQYRLSSAPALYRLQCTPQAKYSAHIHIAQDYNAKDETSTHIEAIIFVDCVIVLQAADGCVEEEATRRHHRHANQAGEQPLAWHVSSESHAFCSAVRGEHAMAVHKRSLRFESLLGFFKGQGESSLEFLMFG